MTNRWVNVRSGESTFSVYLLYTKRLKFQPEASKSVGICDIFPPTDLYQFRGVLYQVHPSILCRRRAELESDDGTNQTFWCKIFRSIQGKKTVISQFLGCNF